MTESKHLGQMMLADCPVCGSNVASSWINDGETDAERGQLFGDWCARGLKVFVIDRYEGDPLPPPCTEREAHRKQES